MPRIISAFFYLLLSTTAAAQPVPAQPVAPPSTTEAPKAPAEQMDCGDPAKMDLSRASPEERKRIKDNCEKAGRDNPPKRPDSEPRKPARP